MSRLSGALVFLAVALALGLWVSPATAGKVALSDGELDKVSASGTPTILESGDASPITFTDETMYTLDFSVPDAQTGVRALTIQNIVGEQQLLVNLNVLSAVNTVNGTDQRNFSLQSWGGTSPNPGTVKTVDGVSAGNCVGADACKGNTGGAGGVAAGDGGAGGSVVVTGGGIAGSGGPGGGNTNNAQGGSTSITMGNASTSPGVISQAASASGDLVARSGDSSPITVQRDPMYTLAFTASKAQSDLAALFVSNVVGESQMAMNLNIASATLNLVPEPNTPFTAGIQNTGPGVIKQVNMGLQFRGTPLSGSTGTLTNFNLGVTAENK